MGRKRTGVYKAEKRRTKREDENVNNTQHLVGAGSCINCIVIIILHLFNNIVITTAS